MNENGFTLIEIIISIALLGIITIAMMSSIQFSLRTLFASGQYMQKNYEVQSKMEDFVGTKTSSASAVQDLEFKWENVTAVQDFTAHGKSIEVNSNSLHLEENFHAFTPLDITPKH
jgi:prepilin-type N-terminal cleavage/methylation domain-containing protein